jgi:peroxiredoxin
MPKHVASPPEVGQTAPEFENLVGADGQGYATPSFDHVPILALIFTGNACPTAKGWGEELVKLQDDFRDKGVRLVLINSNNAYLSPSDSLEEMKIRVQKQGFNFPYLKDESGAVARSFGAVCTPHTFVLDENRRLRYKGRLADSRRPAAATRHDLREALNDLAEGREVEVPVTEPFGCALVI